MLIIPLLSLPSDFFLFLFHSLQNDPICSYRTFPLHKNHISDAWFYVLYGCWNMSRRAYQVLYFIRDQLEGSASKNPRQLQVLMGLDNQQLCQSFRGSQVSGAVILFSLWFVKIPMSVGVWINDFWLSFSCCWGQCCHSILQPPHC